MSLPLTSTSNWLVVNSQHPLLLWQKSVKLAAVLHSVVWKCHKLCGDKAIASSSTTTYVLLIQCKQFFKCIFDGLISRVSVYIVRLYTSLSSDFWENVFWLSSSYLNTFLTSETKGYLAFAFFIFISFRHFCFDFAICNLHCEGRRTPNSSSSVSFGGPTAQSHSKNTRCCCLALAPTIWAETPNNNQKNMYRFWYKICTALVYKDYILLTFLIWK